MLYSIGELLIRILLPDESKKIGSAVTQGGILHDTEKSILGFNYADVGAELASRWKFPEEIVEGIRFQAEPSRAEADNKLSGLIHLAVYVHQQHKAGKTDQQVLEEFPKDVANAIGMDTNQALLDLEQLNGIESGMDSLLDD